MLREVDSESLKKESGSRRKVWYHSPAGDLYVWLDGRNRVVSFQATCYEESGERQEWWLEWDGRGIRAGRVDSKEVDSRVHDLMSPTVDLSVRTPEAAKRLLAFLEAEGGGLPLPLAAFVRDALQKSFS